MKLLLLFSSKIKTLQIMDETLVFQTDLRCFYRRRSGGEASLTSHMRNAKHFEWELNSLNYEREGPSESFPLFVRQNRFFVRQPLKGLRAGISFLSFFGLK